MACRKVGELQTNPATLPCAATSQSKEFEESTILVITVLAITVVVVTVVVVTVLVLMVALQRRTPTGERKMPRVPGWPNSQPTQRLCLRLMQHQSTVLVVTVVLVVVVVLTVVVLFVLVLVVALQSRTTMRCEENAPG